MRSKSGLCSGLLTEPNREQNTVGNDWFGLSRLRCRSVLSLQPKHNAGRLSVSVEQCMMLMNSSMLIELRWIELR